MEQVKYISAYFIVGVQLFYFNIIQHFKFLIPKWYAHFYYFIVISQKNLQIKRNLWELFISL